ncbi:UNVERIFIED_CONTAM: hypothetical protein Sradi_4024800, partial [Sesamum radiatum]
MSVFLWRLFQDRILVDAQMKQKGCSFPSKCQCCEAEETIPHLFVDGSVVQGVWQHFAHFFGISICEIGDLTHMRNAAKYDGVQFSTNNIIFEVQRHLHTLPTVPRAPKLVRRATPSPAWYKLNSNESSLGNPGPTGAMGNIRDAKGQVALVYQYALGTTTSMIAELTAVWCGFELAMTHSLAPIMVEVDATMMIQLLQSHAFGKCE